MGCRRDRDGGPRDDGGTGQEREEGTGEENVKMANRRSITITDRAVLRLSGGKLRGVSQGNVVLVFVQLRTDVSLPLSRMHVNIKLNSSDPRNINLNMHTKIQNYYMSEPLPLSVRQGYPALANHRP